MSWFALCFLPGLGRQVYFKLGLRKARHLRSRRLAVKFYLARQITDCTVLQEVQFSWPGPAVEVTGSLAPFNNAVGLFPSRNTWTLSKRILPLTFPPSTGGQAGLLERELTFLPALLSEGMWAQSYRSNLCRTEPLGLREFRTTQNQMLY